MPFWILQESKTHELVIEVIWLHDGKKKHALFEGIVTSYSCHWNKVDFKPKEQNSMELGYKALCVTPFLVFNLTNQTRSMGKFICSSIVQIHMKFFWTKEARE
jgi:hypothetical protein